LYTKLTAAVGTTGVETGGGGGGGGSGGGTESVITVDDSCVVTGSFEGDTGGGGGVVVVSGFDLFASNFAFSAFVNYSKATSKSSFRATTLAAAARSVLIAQN
jgi:hypothetical protein